MIKGSVLILDENDLVKNADFDNASISDMRYSIEEARTAHMVVLNKKLKNGGFETKIIKNRFGKIGRLVKN